MKKLKLIILDRDGVINYDSAEYIKSAEEWMPIEGSLEAIAELKNAGFLIAVATNQSGVGRGIFNEIALYEMHEKMIYLIEEQKGKIDAIRFCPHAPEDECDCRKPKPGMIIDLLETFSVLPEETLVIGDALRDIEAGCSVGCNTALVLTGKGEKTKELHEDKLQATYFFDNLKEAAEKIIANLALQK